MNNDVENQQGQLYIVGSRGYSAYEIAVQNGFVGTEEEWLESLKGETGEPGTPFGDLTPEQKEELRGETGKSAYQVAVDNGYQGTEEDWVNDFLTSDGYIKKQEIADNLETESSDKVLSANQGKILNESSSPRILGLRKTLLQDSIYRFVLQYSYDGINFVDVMLLPDTITAGVNSAVNLCKVGEYWYVLVDTDYWYTKDFKIWSDKKTLSTITQNERMWATLIYETSRGVEAFYAYCPDSSIQITTVFSVITKPFYIMHQVVNITDGEITPIIASNGSIIIGNGSTTTYIDPSLAEFNGVTYLAIKDEKNAILKVYEYDEELGTITDTNFKHRGFGIEAPKLISTKLGLFMYADPYSLTGEYGEGYNKLRYCRQLELRTTVINNLGEIDSDAMWDYLKGPYSYHIGYSKVDNKTLNMLDRLIDFQDIGLKDYNLNYYYQAAINEKTISLDSDGNSRVCIINHPYMTARLTGHDETIKEYISYQRIFRDVPYVKLLIADSNPNFWASKGVNYYFTDDTNSNMKLELPDYTSLSLPIIKGVDGDTIVIEKNRFGKFRMFSNEATLTTATFELGTTLTARYRHGLMIIGYNSNNISTIPFVLDKNGFYYNTNDNRTDRTLTITVDDISTGTITITANDTLWGGIRILYFD